MRQDCKRLQEGTKGLSQPANDPSPARGEGCRQPLGFFLPLKAGFAPLGLPAQALSPPALWHDYTPYELRNVGALVRLGHRDRAMEALDYFFADVRPRAWNGWAEVVGRELREPRFIGDMPHAWISSDYIRSVLDLFVYERDSDQALVLAAGMPMSWIDSETGVGVREVRTPYGPLTYALRRRGGVTSLTLTPGTTPPGGFVLQWPEGLDLPGRIRIDGRSGEWKGRELSIPATARRIEIR